MKTLQSNFIMAPVKLGYSDGTGIVTQRHLDFYALRNRYIGAIIPEPLYMHKGLRELPVQMGIDGDDKLEGLRRLTAVMGENGAKSVAHLNHPGRMANPKIPGNFFWSSTDKPCENGGATPVKMDREMMDEVIRMFVDASRRAVAAGFDMIELQFGHGYLMAQFLSPAVNDREDEYGGSLENRMKFPLEVAQAVRDAVDVPLIARISGDEMIPDGFHVDEMIRFAAELEKRKYLGRLSGIIRPCLACAEGCLGGVKGGKGLGCVVNPMVNTGLPQAGEAATHKRFAVVGGGLAGMQAAITLRDRGHKVDLFEKDRLGGQFNLAYLPPNKSNMKEIVDYFVAELKEPSDGEINVIFDEATAGTLENRNYDAVIMATGAVPAVPPVKGLKEFYWTEFLEDEHLPENEKVLVIGGGLIGLEVASKLVDAGNRVIIVEMLEEIARGMEMIEKAMTVKKLKAKNAQIHVNHKVVEVDGSNVTIEGEEGKKTLTGIDKIVVATGMKSYLPFEYRGEAPVYTIGDADHVGKAQDAIREAYELALSL